VPRGRERIAVELRAADRFAPDIRSERLPERTVAEVTVAFPRGLVRELVPGGFTNLPGVVQVTADPDLGSACQLVDDERAERDVPMREDHRTVPQSGDDRPCPDLLAQRKVEDLRRDHVP